MFSVHYVYGYLLALSLGNSPHKNTNLFYDSSLPADDLAHISVSYTDFVNRFAAVTALGHRDFVRMIDETLYNIGQ